VSRVLRDPARKGSVPDAEEDGDLVARVASGNLTALGALYDRYREDVRQFVVRATGDSADTDDLVHDVFVTLARRAPTFDGRSSVRPFLLGIASHLVRTRREKRSRWVRARASVEGLWSAVTRHTPEDAAGAAQEAAILREALARLSEDKRLVVLLVEQEGLSGEEVARALGIPVATVWTRLHYARSELRAFAQRRRR
jgi:RNA polymerase sigma factor (sigma-70 family)